MTADAQTPLSGASPREPRPPMTPLQTATLALGLCVVTAGLLWLLAGFASLGWLAHQVPLQADDLQQASWLGQYTTLMYFEHMSWAMVAAVLLMGVALSVVKQTPVPFVAGLILATGAVQALDEKALVRIGVLEDVVKVGCFVPASAECRSMLKLDTKDFASMYGKTDDEKVGDIYAKWYLDARDKATTSDQRWRAVLHSFPGYALVVAPLHMKDAALLKQKLEAQRSEVRKLQQASF